MLLYWHMFDRETVMFQAKKERRSNGGSIKPEPLLCCFIPRGLIHWMCKDDGVTIGDQMGLTTGWKCKECLLNWCSWDEEQEGVGRDGSGGCLRDVHNGHYTVMPSKATIACPFKNKLMPPIWDYRLKSKPRAKLTFERTTRHLNIRKIDCVASKN